MNSSHLWWRYNRECWFFSESLIELWNSCYCACWFFCNQLKLTVKYLLIWMLMLLDSTELTRGIYTTVILMFLHNRWLNYGIDTTVIVDVSAVNLQNTGYILRFLGFSSKLFQTLLKVQPWSMMFLGINWLNCGIDITVIVDVFEITWNNCEIHFNLNVDAFGFNWVKRYYKIFDVYAIR